MHNNKTHSHHLDEQSVADLPAHYRHGIHAVLVASLLALLAGCGGSSGEATTAPKPEPVQPVKPSKPASINVSNFKDNDTIRYSLPILAGTVSSEVKSVSITTTEKVYVADVVEGNFKAVIPLHVGANDISFSAGGQSGNIRINYVAADNPKKVRMMYAIAADDDGRFVAEAGMPNSMEDAKTRIALQALLMQSATAEMLYKGASQRVTYALVEDGYGKPIISTLRLPLTRAQLYAKTDNEIYQAIANALQAEPASSNFKNMVTMGFSSYQNGKIVGHAALGGGNLGIFGSLHLYACPASLDQLSASFGNAKKIDALVLPDDSGNRETYWAQCATGMGASLHELGHTFDLEHTPTGIMSRGFDNFNRLFMLREPGFAPVLTTQNEGGAVWDPISIPTLVNSAWFKR
ncbi:hypothetical protein ACO0LF_31005 [Undibacterium sp. Di27W]|uniref:hypothetical protein n=1 Tax=Undibacterium sp. Di27W TaxID=3413036 RepID=UPI003BF0C9A4